MHQTVLSYETAVPDGGRLAPKNATREREKPAPFAAQESPDDMSDSGGGIRKRPDFGMTRSKDPGLERFCPIGRDNLWQDLRFVHGLMAKTP